ncbi:LPS assembly protein LptD [Pseudomonas sp. FW306-02-F02-AA]|uniref:LPS-assembly protein LptD n=1 Tax=Pseudomonas fluorescens TaxID=294 RepID=A0A0N9VLZ8_PSEFL|nr:MULTISPECIES: LPS-assembly protein LptD [Pseudomonas]ALI00864.1 LPS biosynthesis protein [Pseudomonas fluorescens]PMZ00945.1 LPS assembly protein LptD [Pseudomonas sp. FW306-02-F02-AB]PMZ09548.1 LPS assembly protein LptD [Pseudomonas sp. FW306-02-H06C]PMZ15131.1 LPS assembly protein LptD [Pseudomonas sp. FW306-02-F02-AA]PMZ23509.1 LPS assembly protein LptD [Pseudomonas sp. FW306-02-F08-AA]
MALKSPAFRKKFPLLVTGSLLALQPLATSFVVAAEQYDCSVSASGAWDCAPKANAAQLPPRPVHEGSAVSSGNESTAESSTAGGETANKPVLVTEAKGRALKSRSADYSHLDWVPREKLTAAQLAETGPYCSGSYIEPIRPGMNDTTNKSDAPTFIGAKASRYQQEEQVATLAGDVVMRQGSMQVEADEASLHQAENRGELSGNVRLRDNGALIVGDHADVQLDTGEAQVDNAEYVMHKSRVRGSALYAKRAENAIIRLKDGTYTTCEPNSNAWQLKGNNITLNPATGFGTGTNVTLRVKDIPVFYTPYIYFPIDNRRQSGFLPPSFSTSTKTGFMLVTPYYFNLAPNYDATVYPRYMSKRGLLMEGEFRYLTKSSEGQFGAAYLNDDDTERKLQSDYEKTRYMLNWQHKGGLDSRVMTEVDYTKISDPYYFQDLQSDQIGVQSRDFVNQQGAVTYRGDTYTARVNAQAYQLATIANITPYNRLPQITFNGYLPQHPGGLDMTYNTELVRFDRNLRTGNFSDENGLQSPFLDTNVQGLARATGDRLNLAPAVSLPMNWTYGFLKPSLKYQYTQYDLDLDGTGKSQIAAQSADADRLNGTYSRNQNRGVPIASIDSGLYFDRNTQWFGKNYRQTLEPRLYYLYVPEKDQSDIPVFDTSESTFNYASLFRDNRFTGSDRIGDENKLSLGVTNRWIEDNGFERQRISVGQAMYFKDREVQLPGIDAKTRADAHSNVSPYALEYEYRWNRDWRTTADYNWDPDSRKPRSGSAMFHYQPEDNPNKVINAGYRYRNDQVRYDQTTGKWTVGGGDYGTPGTPGFVKDYYKIKQHDFSVIWPVVPQWNAISRWQYDYNRNRTLEAFGGFEYDNCCWKLRLINRYWVSYDEFSQEAPQNEKGDHGVFLQIVLKGLGGVTGTKVESFLDKGIQGYREREDQAF